jgi:Uma2 family endonuclease
MSATATLPVTMPGLDRRPFTAEEVLHLDRIGFFGPEERIELIEGEICGMTPIGRRHSTSVSRLIAAFANLAGAGRCTIFPQSPVMLGARSLPQPDFCLAGLRPMKEVDHPRPDDIHLLVEVSESTLRLDRTTKLALYAKAGIREYWILNLNDNVLEIHTEPEPESATYRQRRVVKKGETVAPVAFPDYSIEVAAIIP